MLDTSWYRARNDRTLRYAERILPTDRHILLRIGKEYASRFDGQVATIVAANLLARMTPAVAFDVPEIEVVPPLPWAGVKLPDLLATTAFAADPAGRFEFRGHGERDYVLSLGRGSSTATIHGSGWNSFVGPAASRVPDSDQANPVGPALAAIMAVARLFALQMEPIDGPYLFNAFNWQNRIIAENEIPTLDPANDLGSIWSVGLGSVGTAVLYFLSLVTRRFSTILFDMDFVKVENLDRSPIFTAANAEAGLSKVEATERYLRLVGLENVLQEQKPLDESTIWSEREAGTPDLLISAANERDVRYIIEQSAPPLQIYSTTGANWEASVIRHTPFVDPCSCCLFPPKAPSPQTACATESLVRPDTGEIVDASLPFLSFAAGLMAAAEVLKAGLPGYPFSPNRTTLYTHPDGPLRFVSPPLPLRSGCLCATRSSSVHRRMIDGTRYADLSTLSSR